MSDLSEEFITQQVAEFRRRYPWTVVPTVEAKSVPVTKVLASAKVPVPAEKVPVPAKVPAVTSKSTARPPIQLEFTDISSSDSASDGGLVRRVIQ